MNKIEFWLMNNPIRSIIQVYEAKRMKSMTKFVGGNVLEIGCGQGTGTKLIRRFFHSEKITAIDLDPKMVERAKRRIKLPNTSFHVGNAAQLHFEDASFDAVFDFGIIHHIPNWKDALNEIHRVLKPNGEVILEDLSIESFRAPFLGWTLRLLLDHPYKDMYRRNEFIEHAKKLGFEIKGERSNFFWFNLILRKS